MRASEYLAAARWLRALADRADQRGDAEFAASAREFADADAARAVECLAVRSRRGQQAQARERIAELQRQLRRDQAVLDARARNGIGR